MFALRATLYKKASLSFQKGRCQSFQTLYVLLTFTKANMALNEYCPYQAKLDGLSLKEIRIFDWLWQVPLRTNF